MKSASIPSRFNSQVLACAFAIHLFFGSVSVLNVWEIGFFYYFPRTVHITIIDPWTDTGIWALSVVILSILAPISSKGGRIRAAQIIIGTFAIATSVVLLITQNWATPSKDVASLLFILATAEFAVLAYSAKLDMIAKEVLLRALAYLLAFFLAIEASSAVYYVVRAFDLTTSIGKYDASVELQFSYLSYGLMPWLYIAFLFSWAWVPLAGRLLRRWRLFEPTSQQTQSQELGSPNLSRFRSLTYLLDYRLVLALALAVFVGFYPYFHDPPWLVGTDTVRYYYRPLLRMAHLGLSDLLNERHPVMIALLYGFQLVSHATAFGVVKTLPTIVIGAVALLTSWFLARKQTGGFVLIAFALSVLSVTTTVGVFASIFAGWTALAAWLFLFAYVAFATDRGLKSIDFIILLLMSLLIFYLHPWTWVVFAITIMLTAVITLFHDRRKGLRLTAMLVTVVAITTALGLLSLSFLKPTIEGSPPELYLSVIRDPSMMRIFWVALTRLVEVWAPFFSPLYLTTSILGVFYLQGAGFGTMRPRLIICWLCASAIVSVLAAPVGFDPTTVTSEGALLRVFFLTPFSLTAPFGIIWLSQLPRLHHAKNNDRPRSFGSGVCLLVVVVLGAALAFAPGILRFAIILIALPMATGFALEKGEEQTVLSDLILATFVLVSFNYAMRSLSQLLIDPHNDLRP